MTGKYFKLLKEYRNRAVGNFKDFLDKRSRKQSLCIILCALALFAIVDIWIIAKSFRGDFELEMLHIEGVDAPIVNGVPDSLSLRHPADNMNIIQNR